jgi:hypothetical protein
LKNEVNSFQTTLMVEEDDWKMLYSGMSQILA